jgi:hypothetical protein
LLAKTLPLSGAGRAVVRGMESRARRVAYPKYIRGLMAARALTPRITEAVLKREDVGSLIAALDRAAPGEPAVKAEAALADQIGRGTP